MEKPAFPKIVLITPDEIRAIRAAYRMTQEQFAQMFGISLGTLRHWERGDRKPQGPAMTLLNVIQKDLVRYPR